MLRALQTSTSKYYRHSEKRNYTLQQQQQQQKRLIRDLTCTFIELVKTGWCSKFENAFLWQPANKLKQSIREVDYTVLYNYLQEKLSTYSCESR